MQKIKVDLKNIKKSDLDFVIKILKDGKVAVLPTDTIYGLSALAADEKALKKIYKIKKREKKKSLLILVKSYCMLKKYCRVSKKQDEYLRKIWPGPVTVILQHKGNLPTVLTGGADSVAVRLPKNDFLIKIIKGVDQPLVSTSLNLSGRPVLDNLAGIEKCFKTAQPDLLVDAGKAKRKKPSRLIDLRDINNIKILRK